MQTPSLLIPSEVVIAGAVTATQGLIRSFARGDAIGADEVGIQVGPQSRAIF